MYQYKITRKEVIVAFAVILFSFSTVYAQTSPMRDRFGMILRLDFYSKKELTTIILRSAKLLNIKIDKSAAEEIAGRSRGTPRIANRILKRARDFAQIIGDGKITRAIASEALDKLGIDKYGLDEMDKKIINAIVNNFNGGPVGLDSVGVAISENPKTIEEVYEPYLIKEGYIQRTSRGRIALDKANEQKIMDEVYSLSNDITVIFISHKISILIRCNKILSLADGNIKQE